MCRRCGILVGTDCRWCVGDDILVGTGRRWCVGGVVYWLGLTVGDV